MISELVLQKKRKEKKSSRESELQLKKRNNRDRECERDNELLDTNSDKKDVELNSIWHVFFFHSSYFYKKKDILAHLSSSVSFRVRKTANGIVYHLK